MVKYVVNKMNKKFLNKRIRHFLNHKKAQIMPIWEELLHALFGVAFVIMLGVVFYYVFNSLTTKPLEPYQKDFARIYDEFEKLSPGKSISIPLSSTNFIVYIFDEDYVKQNNIDQCKERTCLCAKKDDDPLYCKPLPNIKKDCNTFCVLNKQERQIFTERSFLICKTGTNGNELRFEC